ncbi:MAG TPA: head completion/stabilization protein, partial [Brevundimonas sp.]|nr:head completion/stabilization protein [Brevundimonas sp.]
RLTSAGADRAEELSADICIHTRNVTWAVRDFLGRTRVIAEAL